MNFCSSCGAPVRHEVPSGDDRPRAVCTRCEAIHYRNPRTVVGCLVEQEERVLLCRRAIEPQRGLWTLPAGFLELGESLLEGALRETREEACAEVTALGLHAQLDLPRIGQTYALFRGRLVGDEFAPGPESLEVTTCPRDEIPWDEFAFPVLRIALELYFADLDAGRKHVHLGAVDWEEGGTGYDHERSFLRDHHALELA